MCADQYALALLPTPYILGLSKRARHQDSFYRQRASGLPLTSASLETLLKLKPDAVIRTWGGDLKLLSGLEARGIKIIQINEVKDFPQARSEVLAVATALRVPNAGQAEAQKMQVSLTQLRPPAVTKRVLYYTPSAYSAGSDTWVGHLFKVMGYSMATKESGYFYLSPEVFLRESADIYALGFYEDAYAMRRTPGRHPLVREKIARAKTVTIPSPVLACNAWYGAFALPALSESLK